LSAIRTRRSNWTPRSTFRNAKQVSLAIRSIENRTGRDAKAQEIAGTLGVSLEEYTGWSKARRRAVS
jgi:RNA polymerase sigma factor FliA